MPKPSPWLPAPSGSGYAPWQSYQGIGECGPLDPCGSTLSHLAPHPITSSGYTELGFLQWTSFSHLRPSYIFLGLKSFPFCLLVFKASFGSQFGYYHFWEAFPDLLSSD